MHIRQSDELLPHRLSWALGPRLLFLYSAKADISISFSSGSSSTPLQLITLASGCGRISEPLASSDVLKNSMLGSVSRWTRGQDNTQYIKCTLYETHSTWRDDLWLYSRLNCSDDAAREATTPTLAHASMSAVERCTIIGWPKFHPSHRPQAGKGRWVYWYRHGLIWSRG